MPSEDRGPFPGSQSVAPAPRSSLQLLPLRRCVQTCSHRKGQSHRYAGTRGHFHLGLWAKLRLLAQKLNNIPELIDRWQMDRCTDRSHGSGFKKGREDEGLPRECLTIQQSSCSSIGGNCPWLIWPGFPFFLFFLFFFFTYFIHISVYMSIPISQLIPPGFSRSYNWKAFGSWLSWRSDENLYACVH